MNGDIMLSVKNLRKKYGDVTAVDGVDLEVRRGEIFGLLGPNGAGKTTAIRMICGLVRADAGSITVCGVPTDKGFDRVKPLLGLCPQDIVVWELLTCLEQLKLTGMFYGLTPKKARDRSEELLHQFGLWEKRNKTAKTLSGGMLRRLNIALALVHDPLIIILDEPQAGLDPQSRVLVREAVMQMKRDKTVILTTHDMDEADRLSDRVAIIDRGKILASGTPEKIKSLSGAGDILQIRAGGESESLAARVLDLLPPQVTERKFSDGCFYLGAGDVLALIPAVSRLMKESGVVIEDMTVRKRTLEDAFIAMTGRGLRE